MSLQVLTRKTPLKFHSHHFELAGAPRCRVLRRTGARNKRRKRGGCPTLEFLVYPPLAGLPVFGGVGFVTWPLKNF